MSKVDLGFESERGTQGSVEEKARQAALVFEYVTTQRYKVTQKQATKWATTAYSGRQPESNTTGRVEEVFGVFVWDRDI